MPRVRDIAAEERRARQYAEKAAPYPHPGRATSPTGGSAPWGPHPSVIKGNGLPTGWRWCGDGERVYRERNGWTCVVRTSEGDEPGPFVLVARLDGARQWGYRVGFRTLEDAMAKGDEVMG